MIAKDFIVDFSDAAYSVKFAIVSQARIIHEDENCLVVHQPGRSDFTLITFGGIGHRPKGDWFWGKEAASKLGFDSIGVIPKSDHRYPSDFMANLVPAINAHAQAIRIGYGFSMGAYGALKHGRLLGLTHVLALSPVNYGLTSADIRKIVWDGSFCPERNQGRLISRNELAPINLQVLDPFFALDSEQGELFASAGGIQTIRAPFTDHFTVGLLRGTTNLHSVIDLLLKQDFVGIRVLLNKNRRTAPERASNLARASLARGNRARASKLWQRALDRGVEGEAIERARISGLVEYGRRHLASRPETESEGTETFIKKISLEYPNSLRLQRELAHWCMIYLAPKAALIPLRRAVEISPTDTSRRVALEHALHAAGQTEKAPPKRHKALDACGVSNDKVYINRNLKGNTHPKVVKNRWKSLATRAVLAVQTVRAASLLKYLNRFRRK